jgi:hypothetical protein
MWKETRPGSTAFTNCTGIATRLKLIVPLHMPWKEVSLLLSGGSVPGGTDRLFFIYATFFMLASKV